MRHLEENPRNGEANGKVPGFVPGPKRLFFRNFIKHPRMLGSVIPSSRFLMNRVLNRIDWKRAQTVVEYGPGIGNFTVEFLKRLRPDARLAVIELNSDFCHWLKATIKDPRLHVAHASASDVNEVLKSIGCKHVDYVVSGMPFSTIPRAVRDAIVKETYTALGDDGEMIVYQFSRTVRESLDPVFPKIDEEFELLNVLPARLFYCGK